jgi:transposase
MEKMFNKRSSCAKYSQHTDIKEELLMKYFEAYKEKHQLVAVREIMVKYAMEHTNQEAAKIFGCNRNTISKFVNRKKQGELLKDRSRAPKNIPHKITDSGLIETICKLRTETDYSAERLEKQFDLPISNMTIDRILKENHDGYPAGIKKKGQTKKNLWKVKQHYKTFETKLQMDGKVLTDIPRYYDNQKQLGLPKQQFNIRCVKSGITFTSFMDSESSNPACTFIVYVFEHLKKHGVDVSKLTIQLDAASFVINFKSPKMTAFAKLITQVYKAKLKVVPGGKTKQSDVETFNGIIEREFYSRHDFKSVKDFYKKVYQYMYNFNYIRKNRNKDWKTPLYFLQQDRPELMPDVMLLPPIDLNRHTDMYYYKLNPKQITLEEIMNLEYFFEENEYIEKNQYDELVGNLPNVYRQFNKSSAHDVPIYVIYIVVKIFIEITIANK